MNLHCMLQNLFARTLMRDSTAQLSMHGSVHVYCAVSNPSVYSIEDQSIRVDLPIEGAK